MSIFVVRLFPYDTFEVFQGFSGIEYGGIGDSSAVESLDTLFRRGSSLRMK